MGSEYLSSLWNIAIRPNRCDPVVLVQVKRDLYPIHGEQDLFSSRFRKTLPIWVHWLLNKIPLAPTTISPKPVVFALTSGSKERMETSRKRDGISRAELKSHAGINQIEPTLRRRSDSWTRQMYSSRFGLERPRSNVVKNPTLGLPCVVLSTQSCQSNQYRTSPSHGTFGSKQVRKNCLTMFEPLQTLVSCLHVLRLRKVFCWQAVGMLGKDRTPTRTDPHAEHQQGTVP